MKVLHVFDRYLNTTMNWAHRLISKSTWESHVSAPIQFKSQFRTDGINFHLNKCQKLLGLAHDEWSLSSLRLLLAKLSFKYHKTSMFEYVTKHDIKVYHFHFANVATQYLDIISQKNTKSVISFYGYDYEKLPFNRPSILKQYTQLFQHADLFLTEGHHGRSILEKYGCPTGKIRILHLGINLDGLPSFRLDKNAGELHLIQPATFTPKKGQIYSLQAINALKTRYPNIKLTLVGEVVDESYYKLCTKYISDNQLSAIVEIKPFIDYKNWISSLANYQVIIQPSTYTKDLDCEGGAPVSLIDAQAIGLPCISSFHCDIPEVVLHNQTGILCKEGNINDIENAIARFYSMTNEEYSTFSANAKNHIKKNYDLNTSVQNLDQHYQSLVI